MNSAIEQSKHDTCCDMVQHVCNVMQRLFPSPSSRPKLLLAVSGGVDSVVLLSIFNAPELKKVLEISGVIHIDHGIREESGSDVTFVRKLSEENNFAFFTKSLQPPESGVELWGRNERYAFFEETRIRTQSDFILTAHHQDDEIETFLFRLITGRSVTHASGLIREIDHERKVLRPLLSVTKKEILLYAEAKGLKFVIDSTNEDVSYSRNFIRHRVLPVLEEVNPSIRRSLDEFMRNSSKEEQYLESQAEEFASRDKIDLEQVPEVLRVRVLRILARKDINSLADCISPRRYQALIDMLLEKPTEKKSIDMGHKITTLIDRGLNRPLPLSFIS